MHISEQTIMQGVRICRRHLNTNHMCNISRHTYVSWNHCIFFLQDSHSSIDITVLPSFIVRAYLRCETRMHSCIKTILIYKYMHVLICKHACMYEYLKKTDEKFSLAEGERRISSGGNGSNIFNGWIFFVSTFSSSLFLFPHNSRLYYYRYARKAKAEFFFSFFFL